MRFRCRITTPCLLLAVAVRAFPVVDVPIGRSASTASSQLSAMADGARISDMRLRSSPDELLATAAAAAAAAAAATTATASAATEPSFKNAKAVIFDIDGTLADSWKLCYDATNIVLHKHDKPPITVHEYHEGCRYCTPERLARHVGLLPGRDADFDEVGQRLGTEFDEYYVALVDSNTAAFYDGIANILHHIPTAVKLGALTNACVAYAHAVLKANDPDGNLYRRFGSVQGADSVPKPKPAPDGLLIVCKELGVSPEECVYVGDSTSDGAAADNAGMPSIGVLWGSNSEEKLRTAPFATLCASVDELAALLPTVPSSEDADKT